MLVTNTNPYEGNEVEEAILLVRSEVVDDVKHEVILSGAVDDVVTEVVTSDRTRRREVVELTTLELEAHPEGGSYPATDSEVRVDEANAIAELDVVVVTAEAEGSSVPEFEEPVCSTILDEGSLVRRLLSGLLSLQALVAARAQSASVIIFVFIRLNVLTRGDYLERMITTRFQPCWSAL